MENANDTYSSNYESQGEEQDHFSFSLRLFEVTNVNFKNLEMTTDQFIESLDSSNYLHIRKLAPALGDLGNSTESICGSPDSQLSISWDGACR